MFIFLCRNSLSRTARSASLSKLFHPLWIKAPPYPSILCNSFPPLGQQGKGNTLCWERIQSLTKLIRHIKIYYFIASLFFLRFRALTTEMVYTEVPQSWGTSGTSKSTNRVSLILSVGNSHFSILVHRVRYLKNLFVPQRQQVIIFPGEFKIRG